MKLDYSLTTLPQRKQYVDSLLSGYTPTSNELSLIADYLLFTRDKNQTKQERQQSYPVLTPNREFTINKRQVSYEGIIEKLESGEDGLYSLISNRPIKLENKDPITQKDIETIPGISEGLETIKKLEWQYSHSSDSSRKIIKKTIIETWKQLYSIKSAYQASVSLKTPPSLSNLSIPEEVQWINGIPHSNSPLSLLNPEQVSFLLQFYQSLKQDSWGLLDSDMLWHLIDLENIASSAIEHKYPLLWSVLIWKIDGYTNKQIREKVLSLYGEDHTEQYYSSIWRKRIPKLIVKEVQKQYILNYYLNNYKTDPSLNWKICSKCGAVKPAHPFFFPKNSNKEGFYSQCRECKNNRKED